MGSFANSAFSMILGWLRGAVSGLWQMVFTAEDSSFVAWLGENWLGLVIALCVVCTMVDVIIHLIRWRPLTVYASFFRRLRGKKDEQQEPQPHTPTATVRREWYYPDGTARTEEVFMPEEEAYQQQPQWVQETVFGATRTSAQTLNDHYVRSFAKPEAQVHPGVANKPMEYEDYPVAPEQRAEAPLHAAQEAPAAPVEAPEEPIEAPVSRSRRVLQRMSRLPIDFGMMDDEDELQLRYQPAKPTVDKEQAYHAPVYPPSWRPPAEVGVNHPQEEHP